MRTMIEGWQELVEASVALRRELHRRPELRWEEKTTAARIRAELDRLGIGWRACAGTGTVGQLGADCDGVGVALRADIDALPIVEATGAAWTSEVEGRMHACGHDGHTATLMAAAAWLKRHEGELRRPVTLIFQPAEEGGHGAKKMIEEGALEGVERIFGWHNWPTIAFGRAVCPDGIVMAANGTFRITLTGRGGHASQPESCRDPVLAAAAVTTALQQIRSRRLAPQQAAVISVTSIDAVSNEMVIPDRAVISGSIRVAETGLRDVVNGMIEEIAVETAKGYGVEARVEPAPRYGATVNEAGAAGGDARGAGGRAGRGLAEHRDAPADHGVGGFQLLPGGNPGGVRADRGRRWAGAFGALPQPAV